MLLDRSCLALLGLASLAACFNPPTGDDDDGSEPSTGVEPSTGEPTPDTDDTTDTDPTTPPDGTTTDDDTASTDTPGACGDGTIDAGEDCDDDDSNDGDGCSAACTVEEGFECTGEPSSCSSICGDGLIRSIEECDDGNTMPGDGCAANCAIEPGSNCTGEPSMCSSCGDAVLEGMESCDDGNAMPGDGCSNTCSVELFYRCQGEGVGSCAPIRILFAPADSDDAMFRNQMSMLTGGPVDYFDARDGTPTLAMVSADYDCVISHPNGAYFSPGAMGSVLAQYVDGGGNVVLGIASAFAEVGLVGTPIMTPAYSPVTSVTVEFLMNPVSYAGDGSTVIHAGVMTYGASIVDQGVALQGMGAMDSTFDNGYIASAYRPDFKVVYLNGTGHQVVNPTGNWPRLFANACGAGYVQ